MGRKAGTRAAVLVVVVAALIALPNLISTEREPIEPAITETPASEPATPSFSVPRARSLTLSPILDTAERYGWVPVQLTLHDWTTQYDLDRLAAAGAVSLQATGRGRGIFSVPAGAVRRVLGDVVVQDARLVRADEKVAAVLTERIESAAGAVLPLHIQFYAPVGYDEAVVAMDAAGITVAETTYEVGSWLLASGDADAVSALAADPRVHQIWPAPTMPILHNVNAASLSNVPAIQVGGSSGYNLDGTGVVLALWDGAPVLDSHDELTGRVTIAEGSGSGDHATHVCGTMIASGVDALALGMSANATARSWVFDGDPVSEWNTDKANYDAANNSWGYAVGWHWIGSWTWYGANNAAEDSNFGKYGSKASQADDVTENDDVIQVKSAGNDRNDDGTSSSHSHAGSGSFSDSHNADGFDNGGFDTLDPLSTSKNIILVGALTDAGGMAVFSSWGPTDDGRIKPDVVANGVSLYSSSNGGDSAYVNKSGTSMSAPVVTGIIGLLIHQFRNLSYGAAYDPPASLVKAILVHSAIDYGNSGPDYKYGWGLVDAEAAADLISADDTAGTFVRLKHETLTSGGSFSYQFTLGSVQDVRVTLVWSDPDASANTGGLDDDTSALVHDLNLLIEGPGPTTYYPYSLDVANPNNVATTAAPNSVDNVEQVFISSAATGTYTVTIDHAGSLLSAQKFSVASNLNLTVGGGSGSAPTALTVTGLTSPKPDFSAQHNDPEGDAADKHRIQVGPSAADVTAETNLLWNESATGVSMSSTSDGTQSPDLAFAGTVMDWNTTYYWRIKFWDTPGGNEGDWSSAGSFKLGKPSATLPNPVGWQMVAVPTGASVATSALSGSGSSEYWWWSEALRNYVSASTFETGRGYFVNASPNTVSLTSGTAIFDPYDVTGLTSSDFSTPKGLESSEDQWAGWHVIGNVYNGSINWDTIYDGGHTTNLEAFYSKWDGTQYVTYNASTNSGPAGATIPKFQSFWVHVTPLGVTGSVQLQPPTTFGEPGVPTPFDSNWWLLQLSAVSGSMRDDYNWAGVHALAEDDWDKRDASEPGTLANPYVKLYFDRPDWGPYAGRYHQDVRRTPYGEGDTLTWTVTVEASITPMTVTLSWPNLAEIPGEWSFTLDGIDLSSQSDTTYTQTVSKRTFTLTATRGASGQGTLEVRRGPQTPPPQSLDSGQTGPALQLELTAAAENLIVDPLPVAAIGTAEVGGILLYHDLNGDGALDESEPPVTTLEVAEGTSEYILVVFASVTGAPGSRAWAELDPAAVTAIGVTTGATVVGNGPLIEGATLSIPAAATQAVATPAGRTSGGGGDNGCSMGTLATSRSMTLPLAVLLAVAALMLGWRRFPA